MNFLEKDLETIIWENHEACEARGLEISQAFYKHGKMYRQLNLAPYGIADLVNIRFSAQENCFYVQVLELKKGKVDTAAYLQAKRYQTALFGLLKHERDAMGWDYTIVLTSVIIGNEVEIAGDFIFCLNTDHACSAFTYEYGFDGIRFKAVGRDWVMTNAAASPQLKALVPELLQHRDEITDSYRRYQVSQLTEHWQDIATYGDWSKALIVTASGVLMNEDLLALPEGDEDGAE